MLHVPHTFLAFDRELFLRLRIRSHSTPTLICLRRYDRQFEAMREFLRKKARENPNAVEAQDPWDRFSKKDADEALSKLLRDEFDIELAPSADGL